jgi:uncharacterized protein involved in high-affinity Fe2+ transport
MPGKSVLHFRAVNIAAILGIALAVGGCAKADKSGSTSASATGGNGAMAGMKSGQGSSGASASGMQMGGSSAAGMSVDGIKPVPTQTLASATWEGMKITARAMTAVPFVVYNGTQEKLIKPGRHASFHLMIFLNDAHTGVPIPYATVWATISKSGHTYYDNRQWPMIAAYMGPHYGNDVSVPGAGTYQLSLLISPPVSARHLEYQHVWTKPHRVTVQFQWNPPS